MHHWETRASMYLAHCRRPSYPILGAAWSLLKGLLCVAATVTAGQLRASPTDASRKTVSAEEHDADTVRISDQGTRRGRAPNTAPTSRDAASTATRGDERNARRSEP